MGDVPYAMEVTPFDGKFSYPGSVASALEDLIIEQVAMYRRPVEPGWPAYRDDE